MKFRKLRIIWTVFCGIACVLLLVLWVRSYWWIDYINAPGRFQITSVSQGRLIITRYPPDYSIPSWYLFSSQSTGDSEADDWVETVNFLGFGLGMGLYGTGNLPEATSIAFVHYWFVVMLFALLTACPWLPWWSKRFTLRTLLLATTLIAVVLGLIVWSVR
jgi:hypothetical protein